VKLVFAPDPAAPGGPDAEYPLYFQKADPARGSLTLSFLEAQSPFPLGKYPLDAKSPWVEEVSVKRITSPSGKNFLGVEFRLKGPMPAEPSVATPGKGVFKLILDNQSKG